MFKSENIPSITFDKFRGNKINNIVNYQERLISVCGICSHDEPIETIERYLKQIPINKWFELVFIETIPVMEDDERVNTGEILEQNPGYTLGKWYYPNKRFSFEDARNFAKMNSTSEWILSLDIDELIPGFLWEDLIKACQTEDENIWGYRLGIVSNAIAVDNENKTLDRLHTEAIRLFRNISEIYWKGHSHVLVEWSIPMINRSDIPISIYHTGYEDDFGKVQEKIIRNIKGVGRNLSEADTKRYFEYNLRYMQGSIAYLDAIAEWKEKGLIDKDGKIKK